ncbi:O-antigen ligase family protein, partial [Desulfovibrio sp. OttesenSCG-928-C06]|nr:O-antigen ligase family protein [Desulfovibrio sp. OttesenSCG-928-C06]
MLAGLWFLLCIIALLPDIGVKNSKSIIRAWFLVPPASFIAFRLLGWKGLRCIVIGICLGLAVSAIVYLLQKTVPGLDIRPYRYTFHNRVSLFFHHPADMSALISWCLIVFAYCRLHGKIIFHKKGDWLLPLPLLLLLILGYARGPQLVTVMVIAAMIIYRYRPSLRKMMIALLSVIAIVVLLYNVPASYKHPFYRFTELVHNPLGGSISSRMPIWKAAVYGIQKKPLLGHGVHGFYDQHQE